MGTYIKFLSGLAQAYQMCLVGRNLCYHFLSNQPWHSVIWLFLSNSPATIVQPIFSKFVNKHYDNSIFLNTGIFILPLSKETRDSVFPTFINNNSARVAISFPSRIKWFIVLSQILFFSSFWIKIISLATWSQIEGSLIHKTVPILSDNI